MNGARGVRGSAPAGARPLVRHGDRALPRAVAAVGSRGGQAASRTVTGASAVPAVLRLARGGGLATRAGGGGGAPG
ncbi:hypothetical protein ACFW33_36275, partial [Streptomyces sp. NPDC058830]|uniref:hypothetical protein n=1 Tax=Streptomyces sp. NPDC058830 TaxID=3346645 RepID=UPI0036CC820B